MFAVKVIPNPKIAILGLNSCKGGKDRLDKSETEWISNIRMRDFGKSNEQEIKKVVETAYRKKIQDKWYDYGYVEPEQMARAIDVLNSQATSNDGEYTVVAASPPHPSFSRNLPEVWRCNTNKKF